MRNPSIISTTITHAVLSAISSKGGDANLLLAKLGMPSMGEGQDVWPLAKFTAVLEAAALENRDPLFGLYLGKSFEMRGLGSMATLMQASASAADAFSMFTKYFPALQNNTNYRLAVSSDTAKLSYSITDPSIKGRRQDAQFTIAMHLSILNELLEMDVRPSHIDFQHLPDAVTDVAEYRAVLNCDVRFGQQENAIYLPLKYLKETRRRADPFVCAHTEAEFIRTIRADERHIDFAASIEAWMTSAISRGTNIDIEVAASDFGMSLRSFQRKLSENSINYLELRNDVRSKIGKCLLNSTIIPVTSIALYLGYSETSAFSRHFKRIVGVSPSQYRGVGEPPLPAR
jgi:AraC-like DNA-binding protein